MNKPKRFGPGLLVAAAFIGPGTVTTASVAGARFGYALLWAIVFSILATVILQEMSARLGIVTRAGLGEALRSTGRRALARHLAIFLVVTAIAFGNTAYETGNITGAAIALELITPLPGAVWVLAIGTGGLVLLALGAYRHIEKCLIALVALMSVAFVVTAVMARPPLGQIVRGMFTPSLPSGSLLTVVGLIGTTVVPYNLFLHASVVVKKWQLDTPVREALFLARRDAVVSILLGGVITLAIAISAAGCFALGTRLNSAADMATQLQPILGSAAQWFFALGLFAAGLTSTITAPLAAAFATAGALGWNQESSPMRFKAIWALVIVCGTVMALIGKSPLAAIILAQAANGILLPVIASFLLIVMNRRKLLGEYSNKSLSNLLGAGVVLIAAALGAVQIVKAITSTLEAIN